MFKKIQKWILSGEERKAKAQRNKEEDKEKDRDGDANEARFQRQCYWVGRTKTWSNRMSQKDNFLSG